MTQHRKRCSRDDGADDGSKQDEGARTDNYAPPASTTSDSEGEEWQMFPWDARREEAERLSTQRCAAEVQSDDREHSPITSSPVGDTLRCISQPLEGTVQESALFITTSNSVPDPLPVIKWTPRSLHTPADSDILGAVRTKARDSSPLFYRRGGQLLSKSNVEAAVNAARDQVHAGVASSSTKSDDFFLQSNRHRIVRDVENDQPLEEGRAPKRRKATIGSQAFLNRYINNYTYEPLFTTSKTSAPIKNSSPILILDDEDLAPPSNKSPALISQSATAENNHKRKRATLPSPLAELLDSVPSIPAIAPFSPLLRSALRRSRAMARSTIKNNLQKKTVTISPQVQVRFIPNRVDDEQHRDDTIKSYTPLDFRQDLIGLNPHENQVIQELRAKIRDLESRLAVNENKLGIYREVIVSHGLRKHVRDK